MSKADIDCIVSEKQIWRCPPCTESRKKSMSAVSAAEEGTANISHVVFLLEEASIDRKRMKAQFNTSFEFAHSKTDDQRKIIESQSAKLDECLKIIEKRTEEKNNLKEKVVQLETRLEDMEHYSRANTVKVHGVPEQQGEDAYELVRKVCSALDIKRDQIDVCHRLGKSRVGERPATIIVRFARREDKIRLLAKRKAQRNFSTQHLGLQQQAVPIYINESLSQARRKLYAAAREAKKDKVYTYLWVQNGVILMRKEQGASVVRVSSMSDL